MKFFVDAQLPEKLCVIFQQAGFESFHVNSLPKGDETPDQEIAAYADMHNLIVVTKDSDFYHSHMILERPGKLLLITTGNIKNSILFSKIRENVFNINRLFESCNYVELTNDGLIGHQR